VHFLGFVPEDELPLWYNAARLFAFPSLYEGFGLPVLEAMSRGKVVVAAPTSSLPEVGGDAVVYAEPADTEAFAKALQSALSTEALRTKLARAARDRAAQFTWHRCAAGVVAVIRELLA
jgi:alpha-1,3-rhamnosyl/mannosyltransferase